MVKATDPIASAHERNWETIDGALSGLDEATMARQPSEQCNSISWILWHLSRVLDTAIHTRIREVPQLWVSDGWHEKFGMPPDPDDRGVGWTAAQVAGWRVPTKDVLLGYHLAIREATRQFLATVTDAELDRLVIWPPVAEPRPVAHAFGQVTWDAISHGGQIAYLRGFYQGMGWHR